MHWLVQREAVGGISASRRMLIGEFFDVKKIKYDSGAGALGIVLFFIFSSNANAQEIGWYEKEHRKCEFESPVVGDPSAFTRKINKIGGQYLVVPKSSINKITAAPTDQVKNSRQLTSLELKSLQSNLDLLRASPVAATILLSAAGKINNLSAALKLASGTLINWLKQNAEAEVRNIDRFYDFVTEGGVYASVISFKAPTSGEKPLMLELRGYEVQVGTEANPRRWLSSACLLPVEVVLSKIETKASGPNANNKRLDLQGDGSWRMWDITDQRYSQAIFTYAGQDGEYAYFKVPPDKEYRVHMFGGPFQAKTAGESIWGTLYQVSESE
ncbi:hypothetical protein [Achromobacter piechaudii]|uniref:hypothetical protein n=1 Tax=Achromobacter piechaudii TaxID=72556 RepID=UPI003DA9777D